MSGTIGAVIGLLSALGIGLIVGGLRGVDDGRSSAASVDWRSITVAVAGAAVAAIVAWMVTGWPAVGALAAAAALIAPKLIGTKERRDEVTARSEALAAWAEMLRDTVSAHAGLREAISITARVAPRPIRDEVQRLAARAERGQLTVALRQFAAEVQDPVADLIVAALVIAADRQANRLSELLGQIAASARDQAAMRIRVETGRARTYASSRALVIITFGFAATLMMFSPSYMEPYDSAIGQLVLALIGVLFAGALWGLVELGKPAAGPRILAGVEDEGLR